MECGMVSTDTLQDAPATILRHVMADKPAIVTFTKHCFEYNLGDRFLVRGVDPAIAEKSVALEAVPVFRKDAGQRRDAAHAADVDWDTGVLPKPIRRGGDGGGGGNQQKLKSLRDRTSPDVVVGEDVLAPVVRALDEVEDNVRSVSLGGRGSTMRMGWRRKH